MTALAEIVQLTLVAVGIASLIRALPWSVKQASRKPLSCAACMAGWASILVLVVFALATKSWPWPGFLPAVFTWLAMTGLGTFLLAQTGMFAPPIYPPD